MEKLDVRFNGILIPQKAVDLYKWAVVACDQFTSEPEYWHKLKELVGNNPSALSLILPESELLLGADVSVLTQKIIENMNTYLANGIFTELDECVLIAERSTRYGRNRRGMMMSVNLDSYSYVREDFAPIRATEATDRSRIPPRVKIRENCPIELPHIMLLADDPDDILIGGYDGEGETVYSTELNMGGGHLSGRMIKDTAKARQAIDILTEKSMKKYGKPFVFAVGDGNHSLAAAKHTALAGGGAIDNYALVEVMNIYDKGLVFEPIHRAVFASDPTDFAAYIKSRSSGNRRIKCIIGTEKAEINAPDNTIDAIRLMSDLADEYAKDNGITVDYVHGEGSLEKICARENAAGILMPAMDKSELFPYIANVGTLPKKAFSMGEADEKRYYFEARKIRHAGG